MKIFGNEVFHFLSIYGHASNINVWQDVYFDDESAEVVISSLRLGGDQERLAFLDLLFTVTLFD